MKMFRPIFTNGVEGIGISAMSISDAKKKFETLAIAQPDCKPGFEIAYWQECEPVLSDDGTAVIGYKIVMRYSA